jgi:UDP-GlcNAc3NAcA epimerase
VRVLSVVGNRPQFIKSGPVSVALRERGIDEVVVHTGQHYDRKLSQVFFDDLDLPPPAHSLDLHTSDVEPMRAGIAAVVADERPEYVLVYGDTNSTLAGARAAGATPVAHVEAGLRSGDLSMPEEHNRMEVDRLAALLFAPDERSRAILLEEGVPGRTEVVGDVMADASFRLAPIARESSPILGVLGIEPGSYAVATVHREANVRPDRLARILEGLGRVEGPVILPAHPRTSEAVRSGGLAPGPVRLGRAPEGGVLVRDPVRDAPPVHGVEGHGRGGGERSRRRRPPRDRPGGRKGPHAGRATRALRRRARRRQDRWNPG